VSPRPRRSLVLRTYAFTTGIALAVMIALVILPRYIGSPRYLEPQAALVQNLVERMSQRDPARRAEVLGKLAPRLRGKLTLFDAELHPLGSTAELLERPGEWELAELTSDKWALSFGRIVVRSDDSTVLGVYEPNRPGFPWHFVLPLVLGVLVVVGAASLWFSRRLVRPLGELAGAARRFGGGDTTARARLRRDDELGDVGRAFDDMADRTAALLSAQRQLMADVSHELRTPLARIRVALELAVEDPVAASDVLASVGADLDEIDQLIETILTTARLESGTAGSEGPELRREPISVGELVARSRAGFAARHPGRALEEAPVGAELAAACMECDAVLVRRALDNLLDNAANYSDPATPVVLTIAAAAGSTEDSTPRAGSSVIFGVADRGIGMSADELERAFTPFWRADGSRARRTGGVGLGLALARRIARAHGGDVTLQSSPGRGTTARLEIPTVRGAS
jgi:two-component system, OmpR family, sensor kinase